MTTIGLWGGLRQSEAPHPFPCPCTKGSTCLSLSQKLFQGQSLEKVMWYWEHLHGILDWSHLRPLFKLFKIWLAGVGIHSSCCSPRQALYLGSLCLLKLPPASLVWLSPFFGLSLPWTYRDRFQITSGRLPRGLETNNMQTWNFVAMSVHLNISMILIIMEKELNIIEDKDFRPRSLTNTWPWVNY